MAWFYAFIADDADAIDASISRAVQAGLMSPAADEESASKLTAEE